MHADSQTGSARLLRGLMLEGLAFGMCFFRLESIGLHPLVAFQESALGSGAPDSWAAAAGEALHTGLASLNGSTTILPHEVASELQEQTGLSSTELGTHGILIGALLIDPQGVGLAGLRDAMPTENPDFQARMTAALVPRTARLIVAAAALILVFGPIVSAWTRLNVVEARNAELASMVQDADALERSWPITTPWATLVLVRSRSFQICSQTYPVVFGWKASD